MAVKMAPKPRRPATLACGRKMYRGVQGSCSRPKRISRVFQHTCAKVPRPGRQGHRHGRHPSATVAGSSQDYHAIMMTITDLARELGISVPQARRRLEAISRHLNGELAGKVTRTSRGKVLVDDSLVQLIRQIDEMARDLGVSFSEACRYVNGNVETRPESSRNGVVKAAEMSEKPDPDVAQAIIWGAIIIAIGIIMGLTVLGLLL